MKLVGILNITPDSFSDGGRFNNLQNALDQTQNLIEEGADIIDIGAESTRPNATPISHQEEWQRLEIILPQIIDICYKNNVAVSLDSRNSKTVRKALDLGIDIINDVSGFNDKKMINLASKSSKKIIVMHNLGIPAKKDIIIDKNLDEIEEIKNWAKSKIIHLQNSGIKKENIIFDLGIGFGKDAEQSINILNNIKEFKDLGVEIYVGHSRKSFLDELYISYEFLKMGFGSSGNYRNTKTLLVSQNLMEQGVDYLRVHDVLNHKKLIGN